MDEHLREFVENRLNQYLPSIPEHIHGAIKRYVMNRIEPGGFLRAVLENNFKEAAGRADHINRAALGNIAMFCVEALPMACWGSPDKVRRWLEPPAIADDDGGDE